ncbi:MAG TPA: DNA polymerase/3'-5' exonuclease PolX [Candidatus Polarisedimenticolaceae bacterium]|nr:DNA polymerase/3'-5' exonuclease PolX [Candidatus Polarisedimenticolaceae bacterium]
MIDRGRVADALDEIGVLLELLGENAFKTRAYANAARIVRGLDEDLETVIRDKRLGTIKGIGPALVDKITTLVATGGLPALEELRRQVPPGMLEWLRVPGLGVKKARAIHLTLGISTLDELEEAAHAEKLRVLEGFGAATEAKILEGIGRVRRHAGRFHRPLILEEARRLRDALAVLPGVTVEIAGSARRGAATSKDVDLVAAASDPAPVMEAFLALPGIDGIVGRGPTKCSVRLAAGPNADLRVVTPEAFPFALCYFTGSQAHNIALRGRAQQRGMRLNEYALVREADGSRVPCSSEAEIYAALGLAYVPPELREDAGEIAAAERGPLPDLVTVADLKGILHVHSTWSDGTATIRAMAEAARAMGMTYLGMCDHSRSAAYAGGMSIERVLEQHREIDTLNAEYAGAFTVLKGIEVDILVDGTLDYPDEVLRSFDLVVASVHSRFNLSAAEQTERMIRAVRSGFVDIVGHPTGRILLGRDPYPLDLFALIDAAAERGVAIEVNAHPHRLDLDPVGLRHGLARGLETAIDPDAHETGGLHDITYGIDTARRGGCTAADVLNTKTLSGLRAWLQDRRR